MKAPIVVAGSGKMARDLGLCLLKQGHPVTWLSRDPERLAGLSARLERSLERLGRLLPAGESLPPAGFGAPGDPLPPGTAAVVECLEETRAAKQELFSRLEPLAGAGTLLLSVSSSILPSEIHPRCLGAHFFYPVELTGFAEAIAPEACPGEERRRLSAFLHQAGFSVIEEGEGNAFAANRLLLPVQAECFRKLRSGTPPAEVDEASRTPLSPLGQLSLMDAVGLDVIYPAVMNYLRRMPEAEAADLAHLPAGLGELLAAGKRGRKNGDGILCGGPLPWQRARPGEGRTPEEERSVFRHLLLNTCLVFLEREQLDARGLRLVLNNLFQAEEKPVDILRREGAGLIRAHVEGLHRATGRSYFRPADSLGQEKAVR